MAHKTRRIRPLAALRGVRALIQDPDDTTKVFEILRALSGNSIGRNFRRFRRTEHAETLLAARPDLMSLLSDRERLLALPVGSLGRTYAEFMAREEISADGLVDASQAEDELDAPEELLWFGARLRDQHDLWHVLSGYGRDLVGEVALLAFTFGQIRNPGIGFIALAGYLQASGHEARHARPLVREAWRRGRRARWLPGQNWEALLEQPIDRVRDQLQLGELPTYTPVRSEAAPTLA